MSREIYLLSPTPKDGLISLPMIEFTTTANSINFSSCDTLMFTSKQAVITANSIDKRWREFPSIAVGGATKKQIEDLGGEVIYFPKNFYGEELAKDIEIFFSDRKILYIRPKKVMFNSKEYLAKKNILLNEQIIYETSCVEYKDNKQPPKNSIIIFTSPSTIECFLKNFKWDSSYLAIVIGESTKAHLPIDADYKVANKPLIASCIDRAKEYK
jgi:uroporphyrinogen-III synthase